MSRTRIFNEGLKKRNIRIEEYEEVEVVDRRGNARVKLQKIRQDPPPSNPTTPRRAKRQRLKSLSPLATRHTPRRAPRTSGKSQNDFLREWITKRESFLDLLLELESLPGEGICDGCQVGVGHFRCSDCAGNLVFCRKCFMEQHRQLSFHRIQRWNGKFFAPTTLLKQGYVMHLGHRGHICPNNIAIDDVWEDRDEEVGDVEPVQLDGIDLIEDSRKGSAGQALDDGVVDIVHTTGVFRTRVRWCGCQDAPDKAIQLFRIMLFPASLHRPGTAFTFDALDYFYVDAMECKTAAASFMKKVCRLTNNAFPHMVPNRVRELRRVSRQWRDLQSRKRFGLAHNKGKDPVNGSLAHFCAACPQPGINLPKDWQKKPIQWVYQRSVVVDGNFHADHLMMKYPEDDVTLADGLAFMVETAPYEEHISESRSGCRNHRAMNAANLNRKNRDATGIGACACARHGCFVPHTVVDFQKGERQMNIDYAICNALKYNSYGLLRALVIYDIGCQWIKYFLKRLKESRHLSFDEKMKLIVAVGKFHLSAHIQECFVKYSLNFVQGSGQLDGEILETLWSPFNFISAPARTMSMASRRQLYDDHMRDSNWKKIVGIVTTLNRKMEKALEGVKETKRGYDGLTHALDAELIQKWQKEEEKANKMRGDYLEIYDIKLDQAPSQADIRLDLTSNERRNGFKNGTITWLSMGISLEDYQDVLRSEIRKMSRRATASQRTSIEERRRKLEARLNAFHQKAQEIMGESGDDEMDVLPQFTGFEKGDHEESEGESEEESGSENEGHNGSEQEDGDDDGDHETPENTAICMPSSLIPEDIQRLGLQSLVDQEINLREGQANDCLQALRMALGHKAVLFRTRMRNATTSIGKTRTWDDIKVVTVKVNKHARAYRRARNALERLGADDAIMRWYEKLEKEDLRVSKDLTEENRFGQRNHVLPWFWRLEGQNSVEDDTWMQEFYRVNWLRAKARFDRWSEELIIVGHEMRWTVAWFEHQRGEWLKRTRKREVESNPGKKAYAEKQIAMWEMFVEEAKRGFAGKMID